MSEHQRFGSILQVCGSLKAIAAASPKEEVCGLIVGMDTDPHLGLIPIPITNVHDYPKHNFAMDHKLQNRVLNTPGVVVVGMYHSHNNGSGSPSKADLAAWPSWPEAAHWAYLIIEDGKKVWSWAKMDGEAVGSVIA